MSLTMNFRTAKAYESIRAKIVSGEYPPGTLLSTKDLAVETRVSRTPVRDALRVLEQEGLVVITPKQESRVRSATYEEARELCELRIALESHFAALAAERRTEEDLETMMSCLEDMRTQAERLQEYLQADERAQTWGTLAREDVRFHLAIGDAARNRLLKEELTRFQVMSRVFMNRSDGKGGLRDNPFRNNPMDVWEEHLKLYDAIRLGRRDTAKSLMEEHLVASMKVHLEAKKKLDDHKMLQFV